mgnify:CR=1
MNGRKLVSMYERNTGSVQKVRSILTQVAMAQCLPHILGSIPRRIAGMTNLAPVGLKGSYIMRSYA